MNVSVTISHDLGGTVTVEANHDSDAFSPEVLETMLARVSTEARSLASSPTVTGDPD